MRTMIMGTLTTSACGAMLLLASCGKQHATPASPSEASAIGEAKHGSLWMVLGNTSCYSAIPGVGATGECGTMTCGTSGKSMFCGNTSTTFCCGGYTFTKGPNSSTYGGWYYIVPSGQTGTYQRLKVRFRGDYVADEFVGTYHMASKTWSISAGNGTRFEAVTVTSHPTESC